VVYLHTHFRAISPRIPYLSSPTHSIGIPSWIVCGHCCASLGQVPWATVIYRLWDKIIARVACSWKAARLLQIPPRRLLKHTSRRFLILKRACSERGSSACWVHSLIRRSSHCPSGAARREHASSAAHIGYIRRARVGPSAAAAWWRWP